MGKTMVHSMNDNNPLSGVIVLVVEDDLFLAMDLEDTLAGGGGDSVTPLARRLARRNVPFILHTGMSRSEPSLMEWRDSLIVEKPASPHTLAAAIKTVL